MYFTLLARLLDTFLIFVSKLILVNLLNSGVVITLVVSGILFSVYVAFLLRAALVARLVMPGVLLSTFGAFVFRTAFLTRLALSGI